MSGQVKQPIPFVVRRKADLRLLLQSEGILHPFRRPPFLLRIPELPEPEAGAWEQRLEGLRQECGCTSGALALGAFVVLFLVYALHSSLSALDHLQPRVLLLGGAFFVAGLILSALIGKFLGLSMAGIRFRRTCSELHQRLQALEAGGGPSLSVSEN
jgi:hypothetical protein